MSLYIRLSTNFFTHVKTMRLRAVIGDAAFWVPPRLWVYAAEHQPDGKLSRYTAEEIAMLVSYPGDAQALLQALLRASFLDPDPLRIHGWSEHNGFHQSFSDRAAKAAKARWKRQEKTGEDRKGDEMKGDEMTQALPQALLVDATSNASSIQTLKVKGFQKPSLDDVRRFFTEIGLPVSDGETFFYAKQGNGWMNGKAAIKDWKATVRSWKSAGYHPSQKQPSNQPYRKPDNNRPKTLAEVESETRNHTGNF